MKILVLLSLFGIFSCSSSKEIPEDISKNIENIYFQRWVAGIQGGGSGINIHVNLKTPLEKGVVLEKVQFDTYEANFEKTSDIEYIARINTYQNDLILDENPEKEYGNKAPNVKLKTNEANLYFKVNGKEFIKNLQNVKEKPMLAYPSVKPKN